MNYFVNIQLGATISGIEEAQFRRLQLFQNAGIPAKIIYMGYSSRLYEYSDKFGVLGSTFSMYDFFQGTKDFDEGYGDFDWRRYWEQRCHYRLQYIDGANGERDIRVMDENDYFVMYAHFLNDEYTRIDYINYFNRNHAKMRRDVFDSRGFLSRTSFLGEGDTVVTELYYDRDQHVRLIKSCRTIEGRSVLTKITLKDYNNRDYLFDSETELQTFFLNEINREGDLFFCDRNSLLAPAFYRTKPELRVASVLHNTHVRAGQDIVTGILKHNVYEFTLEHPEHWDRMIVSTDKQKKDLLARFTNLPQVVTIPVGYAVPHKVDFKMRNPHRIIGVARYSPEKNLMHQIQAVERLIPEFPDIELHLYGHGNQVADELRKYIQEHQLTKNVFLRGFKTDLTEEYKQASLALLTSREEGFSLSTLEELSFSIPVISYDMNYGPSDMITDGKNGYLVPANNQEMLTQRIREYLGDHDKQLEMMANCEPLLKKFSPTEITKKWQSFIKDEEITSGVDKK
ncbi:glycosyltransferase [Levilactobacillus tongjiangensis]|uniref:Glycosyltransferase n=1 Tax=Levilactobacillus tongjiangensis TaxID=2486023 RepID=A0ABW1SNY9_9LACO|nr:glycosyltransferase [Levilactobacillus tongjiangensis]